MKYRIFSVVLAAVTLVSAVAFQFYEAPKNRYHQHMEARHYEPCTDHGDEKFCTHLPLLSIKTDGPMPPAYVKDEKNQYIYNERGHRVHNNERVGADITFFDSPVHNNHLSDTPTLQSRARIRIRGATSRSYAKKGYAIKFTESDMVTDKKVSLDGMVEDEDWVLNGPFWDKSLIRNYLCYNVAGEIMEYSPNVRFCEVFLNNEYQGVYLILEKIKRSSDGRIQISKTNPKVADTSFLGVIDRGTDDILHTIEPFSERMNTSGIGSKEEKNYFEIVYPGSSLTREQNNYIERYISKMEYTLYSFDYSDPKKGYRAYIDVPSFVDYYVINEFVADIDAMAFSTYFYKDSRGKLKLAVWDFNLAFTSDIDTLYQYKRRWYDKLMKDSVFNEAVIQRYRDLREGVLSEEYLLNYIDETVEYLGPAADRNLKRWQGEYELRNPAINMELQLDKDSELWTHAEAVEQLKDAIIYRGDFMDSVIDNLQLLAHPSMNKKNNYSESRRFG